MPRWPAIALLLWGCGDSTLDPVSVVEGYRVLAVQATPPQVAPSGVVGLRVFDLDPGDLGEAPPSRQPYVWALCPLPLGALANYRCLDPALEVVLQTSAPEFALDLGPTGPLAPAGFEGLVAGARCLLSDDGSAPCAAARAAAPPEVLAQIASLDPAIRAEAAARLDLEAGVDVQVRVLSGVPGGATRTAAKQIRVKRGAEGARNPHITALAAAREVRGESIRVALTGVLDTPVDAEAGLVSWYSTAGTLDRARGAGDELENTLDVPADALPARVVMVVRDGVGGVDARSVTVAAP